jgi:NADPH:quinone reductase-like Zn-dependent oxidoreductase
MSFEDAAGLGLGVATAAVGLFEDLGVPAALAAKQEVENPDPEFVLVAGGSTATGTRAIQLLKLYVLLFHF